MRRTGSRFGVLRARAHDSYAVEIGQRGPHDEAGFLSNGPKSSPDCGRWVLSTPFSMTGVLPVTIVAAIQIRTRAASFRSRSCLIPTVTRVGILKKSRRYEAQDSRAFVITGSGSGIGAATASWLNERGYLIFAGVRKAEHGDDLKKAATHQDNLIPLLLDVTSDDSIAEAARQVREVLANRGMRLGGLVNNATDENLGPVEVLPLDVFRNEMEVGFFGMVATTKTFLPLLREGNGRIVNMSSVNGRCTFKYHATTCATKYAVEAFSDALRMELKPWGMHVAIVEPGPTYTPLMTSKTVEEFTHKLAKYPKDELALYFPDYETTVQNVTAFVERLETPPRNGWDRLRRLLNGQGWLHHPDEVARVIEDGLTSKRPKTRYLIGVQAKLIYLARRLLGDARFDRFLGEKVFDF